ncbi:MAG: hypothetical protein WA001_03545 [Patescibacteria group bacterium]
MTAPRKPNRRIACAIVVLGFSAVLPGTAFAQEVSKDYPACTKKTSPSDLNAAKDAHKTATAFSERGDYDKAIQYWRDSYAFDCTAHAILLNIATASEKKGDRAAALTALETYQQRISKPDETIAERITKLKAALAPVVAPPASSSAQGPAQQPDPTAPRQAGPLLASPSTPADNQSPTSSQRPFGVAPWIVVGIGGAAAIVGVIMLPVGLSTVSSANSACGGNICANASEASKGNTGRTEIGLGIALTAVGVAAIGSGLTWQFLWNKPAASGSSARTFPHIAHLALAPDVSPHRSGLSMSGSF